VIGRALAFRDPLRYGVVVFLLLRLVVGGLILLVAVTTMYVWRNPGPIFAAVCQWGSGRA
jgi:hypothetical protein